MVMVIVMVPIWAHWGNSKDANERMNKKFVAYSGVDVFHIILPKFNVNRKIFHYLLFTGINVNLII